MSRIRLYDMLRRILLIEQLTSDYKRTGCGTCKRLVEKLQKELFEMAKDYINENETKTFIE